MKYRFPVLVDPNDSRLLTLGVKAPMTNQSPLRRFILYHLPVILYAGLILGISSISNLPAPKLGLLRADSIVHFLEYAIFAFLLFRSISHLSPKLRLPLAALLTLLALSLFAMADEYLQSFIPGRTSDIYDVLADLAGGSAVVLLLLLIYSRKIKTNKEL
jgi:VanZ family protein